MPKIKNIPVLPPNKLDKIHFGNIKRKRQLSGQDEVFFINKIEDSLDIIKFPLPPHRKTVHDFLFLTNGKGVRSKGLNQYVIQKNQFFFLPAMQITKHESMSKDVTGYYIHFSDEIFANSVNNHFLNTFPFLQFSANPIISISQESVAPILNIFARLEELGAKHKKENMELIGRYILTLLTEVKRVLVPEKKVIKNTAAELTQQYKNALAKNIYQYKTVKEYAELLHIAPNHLNKCVKSTINITAQNLLNQMMILEAKSLLKYTSLQISEIADRLCNQTPSNFSRFFKSQTGISPKEYTKQ